jgi:hypothetical protein
VTKQRAQNAADAAAYSAGLWLACSLAPSTCTADTQSMDYRGKQFAAQNAFCNGGDTSYPGSHCGALPSGTSQTVQIAALSSWNGVSGTYAQATVSQQQPTSLVSVLGLPNVTIGATAIAKVDSFAKPPCVLSLKDPITFQGSPTLSSPDCGVASNNTAANGIGFVGNNGINLNAPSYSAGNCSQTAASGHACDSVATYQQIVPDPLAPVNAAMAALKTSDFPNGSCGSTVTSYEAGACYNPGTTIPTNLSGTYYFTGNVKINGSPTISGTATLIFFGGATLTVTGTPTFRLTAMKSPAGPPKLSSSVKTLMTDLLIYDGEAYSSKGVNISGSSTSYFNGTVYVPNSPVTYSGNSDASAPSPACYQVIAYSVNFNGNTRLDNSKCISDSAAMPNIYTVRLVR